MEPIAAYSLLAFLAALIAFLTIQSLKLSIASFDWPTTRGAIDTGEIDELRGQTRIRGKQILYSYIVGDETYTSNRIYAAIPDNLLTYGFHFFDKEYVERNYEGLSEVTVYYHPEDPSLSCIRPGGTKYVLQEAAVWSLLALVLVFGIIGIGT